MTKYKLAISLGLLILHTVYSSDYESAENKIDNVDDNYDTIIVNDVTDVLNDYGNDEFDEEDKNTASSNNFYQLLAEYQKYVDKAAKDKKKSAEKNLGKTRYSLYRKDNNANNNFLATRYTDDYYPNEVPSTKKKSYLFDNMVINPLGLLPTFGPKAEAFYETEPKQKVHRTAAPALVQSFYDKDMTTNMGGPATYKKKSLDPSNCYCPDYSPCNCGCPKCYYFTTQTQLKIPYEYTSSPYARSYSPYENTADTFRVFDTMLKNFQSVYFVPQEATTVKDNTDKTLNINIKVEIQMPNKDKDNKTTTATGARNVCNKLFSLPFPYFSMPFETDFKKVEKPKKHDVSIQKVTVHKKRKNKTNNTLKKNKKKASNITEDNTSDFFNAGSFFNSIQQHGDFGSDLSKQMTNKPNDGINNDSAEFDNNFRSFVADSRGKIPDNFSIIMTNATLLKVKDSDFIKKDIIFGDVTSQTSTQINQTESPIHVSKNISKIRARRDTRYHERGFQESVFNSYEQVKGEHEKVNIKKTTNDDPTSGLLYWPSINDKKIISKHALGKLQKIHTTIKENYNETLEKSSFGNINWSDVDAVAPIIISFMGRYLNGMLTFCSTKVCHSINCGHQQCLYRVCKNEIPYSEDRHCNGSKDIDYKYKIESKVEPQPKIMFEAYEVLRSKFDGILFGKATLCVRYKCMTVVASKHKTSSTECTSKQLINDHCPMSPQTSGG